MFADTRQPAPQTGCFPASDPKTPDPRGPAERIGLLYIPPCRHFTCGTVSGGGGGVRPARRSYRQPKIISPVAPGWKRPGITAYFFFSTHAKADPRGGVARREGHRHPHRDHCRALRPVGQLCRVDCRHCQRSAAHDTVVDCTILLGRHQGLSPPIGRGRKPKVSYTGVRRLPSGCAAGNAGAEKTARAGARQDRRDVAPATSGGSCANRAFRAGHPR